MSSGTLTSFDDSPRRAFVGSPMLARNQFTASFIARYVYGDLMEFIDGHVPPEYGTFSNLKSVVFPRSTFEWMTVAPLGDVSIGDRVTAYVTLVPGWHRITLRVWGIFSLCNPFVPPQSMSFTIPPTPSQPERVVTAYDENNEIQIIDNSRGATDASRIRENVPVYFTHNTPQVFPTVPERIVLNQVRQAGAARDPWSIYKVDRVISFSMFQTTSASRNWYWAQPGFTNYDTLIAEQENVPGFPFVKVLRIAQKSNFSGLNPVSPVSISPVIRYYDGTPNFPQFRRTERKAVIHWVLASSLRAAEYRPVEITDFVMQEVDGGP